MSVLHVRQIERYLREKYESEWRARTQTRTTTCLDF